MSVNGYTPPPFFKRGPTPFVQLALYLIVCLSLLVIDLRFNTLEPTRMAVAALLWPMQKLAMMPAEAASEVGKYFNSLERLQQQNQELRQQASARASQLLRQDFLDEENRRLRSLLLMREQLQVKTFAADVLYEVRDVFSRRVVIDQGVNNGVEIGQAVIDAAGVLGQVTRVFPLSSEVTLLDDKHFSIPVQVQRTGLKAILAGTGGALEVKFLPANVDIQAGDVLTTSGLDGIYPAGLLVARVATVERNNSLAFARIVCEATADLKRYGQVLLLQLSPMTKENPSAAQATAAPAAADTQP